MNFLFHSFMFLYQFLFRWVHSSCRGGLLMESGNQTRYSEVPRYWLQDMTPDGKLSWKPYRIQNFRKLYYMFPLAH